MHFPGNLDSGYPQMTSVLKQEVSACCNAVTRRKLMLKLAMASRTQHVECLAFSLPNWVMAQVATCVVPTASSRHSQHCYSVAVAGFPEGTS